jgi:hypothetical protein
MELLFSLLIQTTSYVGQFSYFVHRIVIKSFVNAYYNLATYRSVQCDVYVFSENLFTL